MCRAQQAPSTDVRATTHNICCLVPDGSIVYCRRETNTDSGSHGTRVDGGTWVDAWETKQFQNQVGIRAQAQGYPSFLLQLWNAQSSGSLSYIFVLNEELSIVTEKIEADTNNKLSLFYPTASSYPLLSSFLSSSGEKLPSWLGHLLQMPYTPNLYVET